MGGILLIQLIKKVHVFRQGAWRSGEILIAWERSFRDGENMHCIQRIERCQSFQSFFANKKGRQTDRSDSIGVPGLSGYSKNHVILMEKLLFRFFLAERFGIFIRIYL